MQTRTSDNREFSFWAAAFSIFLCILFGANTVAIKVCLTGMGVFTSAGLRFALAALAIYAWCRATDRSLALKKGQLRQLAIVSACFTVQLSFFYIGLSKTNASRGTLMINLLPFFVLFLAHHFIPGDRITRRKLAGMLLGFAGVVFVLLDKGSLAASPRIGDGIVLGAAVLWSCNTIYIKRINRDFDAFQLVFYPMVFSLPFYLAGALWWDEVAFTHVGPGVVGAFLYQSLVTAAFGFVAWNQLLQRYGAVALHSFVFIMPVTGVLLGGVLLQEPISAHLLTAMVLIAAGILVVHLRPERNPVSLPLDKGC